MDSFEDIIILIFIIFSIFTAFFRKKKEQKKRIQSSNESEKVIDPFEILEEKKEISEVDSYFEKISKKEQKEKIELPIAKASGDLRAKQELEKIKWKAVKSPSSTSITIDPNYYETSRQINSRALSIKRKIKNTKSLREYVILSEILSKPLSLRE
jgi:hypothetical protein